MEAIDYYLFIQYNYFKKTSASTCVELFNLTSDFELKP